MAIEIPITEFPTEGTPTASPCTADTTETAGVRRPSLIVNLERRGLGVDVFFWRGMNVKCRNARRTKKHPSKENSLNPFQIQNRPHPRFNGRSGVSSQSTIVVGFFGRGVECRIERKGSNERDGSVSFSFLTEGAAFGA